jgi:aspartate 1-decarboxylase
MRRSMFKSKIHRASVTHAGVDEEQARRHRLRVVFVDAHNRIATPNSEEVAGPTRREFVEN